MGGCCSSKKEDEEAPVEGIKPDGNRKCKDVLFIILFAAFWFGNIIVAAIAVANGEPERLIYGVGYDGDVCGASPHKNEEYIYYPRMHQDLLAAQASGIDPLNMDFYGICLSSCPEKYSWVCPYDIEAEIDAQVAAGGIRADIIMASSVYRADCFFVALDTFNVFFRCLQESNTNSTVLSAKCTYPENVEADDPLCQVALKEVLTNSEEPTQEDPLMEQMSTWYAQVGRAGGDLTTTLGMIAVMGGVLPLFFSCVWLVLLRLFAGVMVWLTVFAVQMAMLAITLFTLNKGGVITGSDISAISGTEGSYTDDPSYQADKDNEDLFKIVGYIAAVLTFILFVLIVAMRSRIRIAVGIFREGSKAIGKMMLVTIFPVVPFIMSLALWIYVIIIGAYIYSMGDITTEDFASSLGDIADAYNVNVSTAAVAAVDVPALSKVMAMYHFFGFLWTNQLIQAISMTTIAGAISAYYWSENKTTEEIGRTPVLSSFKRVFRYHLGSLLFGSLIIAIIQFLRAVLAYIDRKTKRLQNANVLVKVAMKCIQCCMWCFEKCMKFLSRNAYIIIAMKGASFCGAAKQAFWLIISNIAQIGTVNMISNFLLLLARVTVTAACAVFMFMLIDGDDQYKQNGENELNYPIVPTLAVTVIAWFVASMFMGVYDMAVDTILLCFCEDRKVNKASGKYFMSDELRKYIGANAREKKEGDSSEKETANPVGNKASATVAVEELP